MTLERPEIKTVLLEGPVTIYEVAAHRDLLREALAEGVDLRVELGGSGKWDLSGLQLLISCANTAQGLGQELQVVGVPRLCQEIAARSGLDSWLAAITE